MTAAARYTVADVVVGEAVVIDHAKRRIRSIGHGVAELADAGPHWRTSPIVDHVSVAKLRWDRVAGVFRFIGEIPVDELVDVEGR